MRARPRRASPVEGACLVVIDGPRLGQCIHVHGVPVVIGRSPSADFQVEHGSVSRLHCTVWHDGNSAYVRDLGSKNGTRVNGTAVQKAELGGGDHIALGDAVLKYIPGGSVEAHFHAALYELATLDNLTQVYNRREFRERLDHTFNGLSGPRAALSLAIVDLDHFKQINDSLGHDSGDEVLRRVSETLRQRVHRGDCAGRLGGDEFAVLLCDTRLPSAVEWCEELRGAVSGLEQEFAGLPHAVSVSIGVATWMPAMKAATELMRGADMALLNAKSGGRNRVCVAQAPATGSEPINGCVQRLTLVSATKRPR